MKQNATQEILKPLFLGEHSWALFLGMNALRRNGR